MCCSVLNDSWYGFSQIVLLLPGVRCIPHKYREVLFHKMRLTETMPLDAFQILLVSAVECRPGLCCFEGWFLPVLSVCSQRQADAPVSSLCSCSELGTRSPERYLLRVAVDRPVFSDNSLAVQFICVIYWFNRLLKFIPLLLPDFLLL